MVFHPGELWVQERLGQRETVDTWAPRAIRSHMPDQHREMFRQLPFLVAAGRDDRQKHWATLLTGSPGFAQSPSSTTLRIASRPLSGDALERGFRADAEIGLLGIDLYSKRRNRANGTVTGNADGIIDVAVHQSYGNCPQYITRRSWRPFTPGPKEAVAKHAHALDNATTAWIRRADTFFVASGYPRAHSPAGGMDASHRSGAPGLVEVLGKRELLFPDYAGNNFFNTLGNLVMNPDVGLLFIDFERGGLLQLNGRARIDWDSPEVAKRTGARRLVRVDIEDIVVLENILPIRW
ncbi:pyridoxamine 5'-phosphate oxidase family protein [Parahaliea mediterranea]|uniref:Pyridoxamine 5'-phosphate oxidase family protein n=1 Tax=Parahaliea mediterranea TaxID=651086 RepID=A0A939DE51_9GAMM|nr:pyridoxamine 5'-phosphate oxidase family protein [Parahaliea mediterranea]MBN7795862.1 pyridoxamine 5'-phosphate oxidase family protein [Parahaliea mediterranea]